MPVPEPPGERPAGERSLLATTAVPGLEHPITASAYADRYGLSAAVVVAGIRGGTVEGTRYGGVWYADDVPPPDRLAPSVALPAPAGPARERPAARVHKVTRYTSRRYVDGLMALLAVLIAVDVLVAVADWDAANLRGVGTRVLVLAALRTQHRRARLAVQIWSGGLVVAGVAGMSSLVAASRAGDAGAWWGLVLFGGFLAVGGFTLATAHRYIKLEAPPSGPASLDEIAREARLD